MLRGGEDITQSSIQRFYPGLVGLAITDIEDELTESRPKWETKGTQTKRVDGKRTNQLLENQSEPKTPTPFPPPSPIQEETKTSSEPLIDLDWEPSKKWTGAAQTGSESITTIDKQVKTAPTLG